MRLLVASQPSNGSVDSVHSLFRADGAKMKGDDKTSFKDANLKQVRVVPDRSGHG